MIYRMKLGFLLFAFFCLTNLFADANMADLAKKLSNPVAALISVPIDVAIDEDVGPRTGTLTVDKLQPVIPMELNDDWNVISRTIISTIYQDDILGNGLDKDGLGDILQSFFFSPKEPTSNGWIWGVGPALLLDTASEDVLGGGKWGAGPTAVLLKQNKGFTYGLLLNHLWDYAGDSNRDQLNNTYAQPILSYTIQKTKTTFAYNMEYNYDWTKNESTAVNNMMIGQMFKIGNQIMDLKVGARYWSDESPTSPKGWGSKATLTFLFPK